MFSVIGSSLENSGNTLDLLNLLPNVDVQGESVKVYGRGEATIYLNGRKIENKSELSHLSSEDISRVELVQNPGARYDAQTMAVIRIYTRRKQGEGISINEEVRYGTNKGNCWLEDLSLNYRNKGLDVNLQLWGETRTSGYDALINQTTYLEQTWTQLSKADNDVRTWNISPTIYVNYLLGENQSLGFRYSFNRTPKDNNHMLFNTSIFSDENLAETSNNVRDLTDLKWSHSVNCYYSGQFGGWTMDVNSDFLFSGATVNSISDEEISTIKDNSQFDQIIQTYNRTRNQFYAVKGLFSRSLWEGLISFGGEYSHTNRNSLYLSPQQIVDDDDSNIK